MQSKDYIYKESEEVEVAATVFWKSSLKGLAQGIALGFHGGGFVIGSRYFIPQVEIEYLANANFVVVSADYRLCPQVDLPEVIQDAIDAFTWCKMHLPTKIKAEAGIDVDPHHIVAFGQSAGGFLALHLGGLPDAPRAILDFYGTKYITEEFWHVPLPALARIPELDQSFLNKIYEEPVLATTVTSLEKTVVSQEKSKKKGMPPPNLSIPRNAWLFTALKNGTLMKSIVKDGDFERIDPTRLFTPSFPPTFFVHGQADDMVLTKFSEQAFSDLSKLGVKTGIVLVPDRSHGFDAGLSQEDAEWAQVREGLDFLIENVKP